MGILICTYHQLFYKIHLINVGIFCVYTNADPIRWRIYAAQGGDEILVFIGAVYNRRLTGLVELVISINASPILRLDTFITSCEIVLREVPQDLTED